MKRTIAIVCGALLVASFPAQAADTDQSKTATRSAKPSRGGPGTQTEDELYIGARQDKGAHRAQTVKQTAGARKPNKAAKPRLRPDDDLEDLEVMRNR